MSSPAQETYEDFENLLILRDNFRRIDEIRDEFLCEAKKCRQEEDFLGKVAKEMENLHRQKFLLVEALKQIHHDIKQLETITRQSETEKKQAFDNAQNLLKDLQDLKLETNSLCSKYDQETLPENLIKEEDEEKFRSPSPLPVVVPTPWPIAAPGSSLMLSDSLRHVTQVSQSALIPCTEEFNRALGVSKWPRWPTAQPLRLPTANFQDPMVDDPGPSGITAPNKQQQLANNQAPMKTCEICQQEIHRNSPTCPVCHSKCRSKNPKSSKKRPACVSNKSGGHKKTSE